MTGPRDATQGSATTRADGPRELFQLRALGNDRFTWVPPRAVMAPGRFVYGGALFGAVLAAFETVVDQPLVWSTVQFAAPALEKQQLSIEVERVGAGAAATQLRCTVRSDRVVCVAGGATAAVDPRARPTRPTSPPCVVRPDDCAPFRCLATGDGGVGDTAELRLAQGRQLRDVDGTAGSGAVGLWGRVAPSLLAGSSSRIALLADMLPLTFADAVGRRVAGTSIDNTIRLTGARPTEWCLIWGDRHLAGERIGHVRASLWNEAGELVAEAAQSVLLRDHAQLTRPRSAHREAQPN